MFRDAVQVSGKKLLIGINRDGDRDLRREGGREGERELRGGGEMEGGRERRG